MKVDEETKIQTMLQEAKIFVSEFDEILSKQTEKEIKQYREKISKQKITKE